MPLTVNESASAADYNVYLVLNVRSLVVREHREGKPDVQGAALQGKNRTLANETRDCVLHLGESDYTATVCLAHKFGRRRPTTVRRSK